MWSRGYRVTDDEARELYNAVDRRDGMFYLARAAGFVADHKAQGDRLDFGRLFKVYGGQFPFLVGGSEEDPFEHRQIDLARERLGGAAGLQIAHLPGGHLTTHEQPEALAALIAKFERTVNDAHGKRGPWQAVRQAGPTRSWRRSRLRCTTRLMPGARTRSRTMPLLDELRQLVCDLVAIESVNPDLVAYASGESQIATFVASWLRSNGLEVEIVEPVPGRPSVVGVLRGSGGGRSLMLNAHMDTVGAGGMVHPFDPIVDSGRVYGRGAYDMKGSLAAIMIVAKEAAHIGFKGDLIITAVADEEVASFGTSAVLEQFRADTAIVTEPTELRLCIAHKGFVWLEVESRGVAAHGSRSDIGLDAIGHMGRILTAVIDLDMHLRRGRAHQLLGTGSIHASLIDGGQELSTYPARCVVKLERRTIPGEDGASAKREIEETIARAQQEDPQLEASVRILLERLPSDVKPDNPVAAAVASAGNSAVGSQSDPIGVAYWMDMSLLNAAGIPTVAFGPSGKGEHADVEWVDLASLEVCVRTYLKAAEYICDRS